MEYYNRTLCVSYEDLTEGKDPIVGYKGVLSAAQRGRIVTMRKAHGEGRYALFAWASLPAKWRARYVALYGEPEDAMRRRRVREAVVTDEAAWRFYDTYRYDLNGTEAGLTEDLKHRYTLNASVLNALVKDMDERASARRTLGMGRQEGAEVWRQAVSLCETLREALEHTLPANEVRLMETLKRYRAEGYGALVSRKVGNASTRKVTEEGMRLIAALMQSKAPVYTVRQAWERYNVEAAGRGWKRIGLETFRKTATAPDLVQRWWSGRHGELSAHQRFDRQHLTELPTLRDALWYGDGTRLNLFYRAEDGSRRTLVVYEVMDAATEVLLGYAVGETENYELQYRAYRMAVETSGHRPYEIVHDNQGGHRRANRGENGRDRGMLDKICRVHRTTKAHHGASKTIEEVFGRFQREELHRLWGFTGQNVTARSVESGWDKEFVLANAERLPGRAEMLELYAEARQHWNEGLRAGTGRRRIDLYAEGVNPEAPAMTEAEMLDAFWVMTPRAITFTAQGIRVAATGRRQPYEVLRGPQEPDYEWRRRNTGRKFRVMYDPLDTTSIRLYAEDAAGRLRFERVAEPYLRVHRAIQDQTEGEGAWLRTQQGEVDRERVERVAVAHEVAAEWGMAPEQHGLRTPDVKGVAAELQRQLEGRLMRTRRRGRTAELTLGQLHKMETMATRDELERGDLPQRRAVGDKY